MKRAGDDPQLTKSFRLIDLVAQAGADGITLSALAAAAGYHKSTVSRQVARLVAERLLERRGDRRIGLGPRILGWSRMFSSSHHELIHAARPVLQYLSTQTGETVNLGIPVEAGVLYIDAYESQHHVRATARIGGVDAYHTTALGKALLASDARLLESFLERAELAPERRERLLADLAETRARGYAVDDEENEPGLRCVGAPVFAGVFPEGGRLLGAISVSGPSARLTWEAITAHVGPQVVVAAREISTRCGSPPAEAPVGPLVASGPARGPLP